MTRLIFLVTSFLVTTLSAQTFNKDIEKGKLALTNYETVKAISIFENLSKQHTDNWLPNYYAAQTLITEAFINSQKSLIVKEKLTKAQIYLDKAHNLTSKNEEVIILQAKLYLAYVVSNSEVYGRQYSGIISKLYNDAYVLNPKNPRVVLGKAQWEIGAAKYFGSDTSTFCADLEKAVKLFDTFKQESSQHPNWGEEEAVLAVKNCK
ncbi:hypothetical protein [Aurantibacter sp.]|uniref:hypothetical protein n=1 Tax=Aurantibacter sp. TaxID=2807103 RepID=UPI0035C85EDF